MAVTAALRVPVEICRLGRVVGGARWFRLARGVSEGGVFFDKALPEELEGPLTLSFFLPEDPERLSLSGRAVAVETGDEAAPEQRLAIRFLSLDDESRARIARYVTARVPE